jgi:hypothetical protein
MSSSSGRNGALVAVALGEAVGVCVEVGVAVPVAVPVAVAVDVAVPVEVAVAVGVARLPPLPSPQAAIKGANAVAPPAAPM